MCGNMVSSLKMTPWLMAVFCLATAGCSNVTDQQTSESQHDQVAILKQIRKVNEDGSYSFGYEAGDGSFKVETRDVLGNIKGTFGFVDADGEIKRVSYSSSNGTGFKSTTVSPLQEQVSVVQSIPPRVNRSTSTTRKPPLIYATSTESSTARSSVVQAIPRTRKTTTTTQTTTTSSTTENPRPIFGHYIKATGKNRPRYGSNGQQRSASVEEDDNEDSQITRPSSEERTSGYRRLIYSKRPIDHSLRPITEEFDEREVEPKVTTGNTLRRQLQEETTTSEATSVGINDDRSDVYGGSLSTTRPLFTTNAPPRLIHRLANPRTERTKNLFLNQNNLGPARFESDKYATPRVYEEESKISEERPQPQQILIRSQHRIPSENRDYVRPQQTTESIYVRQQPEHFLHELSSGDLLVRSNNGDEEHAYRSTVPLGRILYRPPEQPLYSTTTDANVHYISETPITEPEETARVPMMPSYVRPRLYHRPPPAYVDQEAHRPQRPMMRPVSQQMDERDYSPAPLVAPEYPYRSSPIELPPEPPNPIAPPLSRRDFQLLLRRLLVSQYGTQALSYPRTYLEDALYDQQPYPSYQPAYQTPVTRQALAYDPTPLAIQYGDRVPLRRPGYTRFVNPMYTNQGYEDYHDGRLSKRVYRQKFYTREVNEDEADEVLPSPIREALLLRMIQLAINSERPTVPTIITSTTPSSVYRKTGPVRSVQIITDDEDDKDSIGKKM